MAYRFATITKYTKEHEWLQYDTVTKVKFLLKSPDGHIFIDINLFNLWALQNNFSKENLKILQIPYLIITAAQYARITGYTIKAIERKREEKIWGARIVFKDPLGNLSINIKEAEKWIEGK